MNIEEFRSYCLAKKGVTESFPFDEHTLVFKVMGKMFALSGLERIPAEVNLKCDPERSAQLREEYDGSIQGAFHMNKLLWNSVVIGRETNTKVERRTRKSLACLLSKISRCTSPKLFEFSIEI